MATTMAVVIAWLLGCMVGIGIGGNIERYRAKRYNERKFVSKHRRVG